MNFYFPRNDQSAKKASGASRIPAHEFCVVKITQAYWGVSQGGARFLAINLVNANNETTDELKIYFENKDGEQLSGYHQINAILAFNGIAGLNQVQGKYKSYDFEAGGLVDKQGFIAPELVGAYVGVVLSENWYQGQNGVKHNLNLSAVYHYKTQQNARQFLENQPATAGQVEQSIAYAKKVSEASRIKAEQQAPAYQRYANVEPSPHLHNQGQGYQAPQQSVQDDDMPF